MTLKKPDYICIPKDSKSSVSDERIDERIDDESLYSYPISIRIPIEKKTQESLENQTLISESKPEVKQLDRAVEKVVVDKINILLVLPAIGDDNFNQKLSFLSNNIRVILSTAPSNAVFEMFITCYKLTNVEIPITILLGDPPTKTLAVHKVNPVDLIR
ncbi:MAG: hypothetical protein WD512_01425, partial [Candidatus Paceibacterota bacterium]